MSQIKQLYFSLAISQEKWLSYYAGHATSVQTISDNGLTLQLPASALRPFIAHDGVNGHFVVRFDQHNKLIGLERTDKHE